MKKPFSSDGRRMLYVESEKRGKKKHIKILLVYNKKAVCKGENPMQTV